MKKYSFIIFLFVSIVGIHNSSGQQLLQTLMGKWNVKEYHNNKKVAIETGFIDFQQDGVFETRGTYFGSMTGLYRTDETRSIVLFDNGKTTEWKATVNNNILRLDRIMKKPKKSTVYIILVREGKDENQTVIN